MEDAVDPGSGNGTYKVAGDTITWLGGNCEKGQEGVHTFTLVNDTLTFTATDDPCVMRSVAYNGQSFTRLAEEPGESSS